MQMKTIMPSLLIIPVLLQLGSTIANINDDVLCDERVDIAIVGAGAGGAYSAYQLRNHGKRIAMFEVSDRVGGRLYTARLPEAHDSNLELGGMRFFEGGHTILTRLVKELGLATKIFKQSYSGYTSYYFRGQILSPEEVLSGRVPYILTDDEDQNRGRIKRYIVEKLLGRPIPETGFTREELLQLRDKFGRLVYNLSIDEALDPVTSPESKAFIIDLYTNNISLKTALFLLFLEETVNACNGCDVKTVVNGMDSLPKTLVDKFLEASDNHSLQFSLKLEAISGPDEEGQYRLSFKQTDINDGKITIADPDQTHTICATQVILALPHLSLTHLDWPPLKSDEMQYAFKGTEVVPAHKVFMTFDQPWWQNVSRAANLSVISDKAFCQLMEWDGSNDTNVHVLLVSYASESKTRRVQKVVSRGELIKGSAPGTLGVTTALKNVLFGQIAEALGISRDDIPEPVGAISQFWDSFPFGGSWVSRKPNFDMDAIISMTRRPDIQGEVYIVGSDYSWGVATRWTEGALETSQYVIDTYFKNV